MSHIITLLLRMLLGLANVFIYTVVLLKHFIFVFLNSFLYPTFLFSNLTSILLIIHLSGFQVVHNLSLDIIPSLRVLHSSFIFNLFHKSIVILLFIVPIFLLLLHSYYELLLPLSVIDPSQCFFFLFLKFIDPCL